MHCPAASIEIVAALVISAWRNAAATLRLVLICTLLSSYCAPQAVSGYKAERMTSLPVLHHRPAHRLGTEEPGNETQGGDQIFRCAALLRTGVIVLALKPVARRLRGTTPSCVSSMKPPW